MAPRIARSHWNSACSTLAMRRVISFTRSNPPIVDGEAVANEIHALLEDETLGNGDQRALQQIGQPDGGPEGSGQEAKPDPARKG